MGEPREYSVSKADFDLNLRVKRENQITGLQDFQSEWMLRKFLNESIRDLLKVNDLAGSFVRGTKRPKLPGDWANQPVQYDDKQLLLEGHQVMQSWEHRIMEEMARVITETHGDVLEIGFGMGISATYINDFGVRSYTVVEPNHAVIEYFNDWKKSYPTGNIRLIHSNWQDASNSFGKYDGVLFDPYFVSEPDSVEVESTTGVGSFLPLVIPHLRKDGIMTYFTREIDSLSRAHQRMLFRYFSKVEIQIVRDLIPPDDCDYWWANSMAVVKATR